MAKATFFVCLCALAFVAAQQGPPPQGPPPNGQPPQGPPPSSQYRVVRQAPAGDNGPIPAGMNGGMGPGNLGMQGLGNIPDPTVWIAKGQEIASQFAKGRRRRQVPKIPDGIPMPPMPKMNH